MYLTIQTNLSSTKLTEQAFDGDKIDLGGAVHELFALSGGRMRGIQVGLRDLASEHTGFREFRTVFPCNYKVETMRHVEGVQNSPT